MAADEDKLWKLPRKDIVEVLEHCEDVLSYDNLQSRTLLNYLRMGLHAYDNYLGFGSVSIGSNGDTQFVVMPTGSSLSESNRAELTLSAPEKEPALCQYPTRFAWLVAHSKWKLAKLSTKPAPSQSPPPEIREIREIPTLDPIDPIDPMDAPF